MLSKDFLVQGAGHSEILGKGVRQAGSVKGVVLAGDSRGVRGEVGLHDDWGEVDEICNSDRCNIVVVCVFIINMLIILFTLGGLSNTRRFAFVGVREVFIVVFDGIILTVVIGVKCRAAQSLFWLVTIHIQS
jgi:hypothetical protein